MAMRIKGFRKKAGLTQVELANNMGVEQDTVSNWEAEINLLGTRQLPDLAGLFGVTINDLFTPEVLPSYGNVTPIEG